MPLILPKFEVFVLETRVPSLLHFVCHIYLHDTDFWLIPRNLYRVVRASYRSSFEQIRTKLLSRIPTQLVV